MLVVLTASRAELLDDELFRHRPLVLGRVVIGSAALGARHLDRVAHGCLLEGLHASATTAGREEGGNVRDFCRLSMIDVQGGDGLSRRTAASAFRAKRRGERLSPLSPLSPQSADWTNRCGRGKNRASLTSK